MRFSIVDGKSLCRQKKRSFKTIYNILPLQLLCTFDARSSIFPTITLFFFFFFVRLSCLFSFVSSPLIQSFLNLVLLSPVREQVKGRKMITFTHSLVKLGDCRLSGAHTHTHTALMDERSHTKDVNMIHGSFVGISPTHIHVNARACSWLCLYFRNALFCQHIFFIMPDGFHPWHFTSNKTYYTVWMSTTRKKQGAFNTLPPVSHGRWKKVQGGVFIPRHTATHSSTHPRHRCRMPLIVLALFIRVGLRTSGEGTQQHFLDECTPPLIS